MSAPQRAPFKHYQVRCLLVALAGSANEDVAVLCRTLLAAPDLKEAVRAHGARFGGFMSRVVEGDFIEAFASADGLNRTALVKMVLAAQFDTFDDDADAALALYGDPTKPAPRGVLDV